MDRFRDIIKAPIITEKSQELRDKHNTFVFSVDVRASKIEIKEAIEKLFNVEVLTLSRMAYRVSNEIGGEINHLSKAGKDMLIFDLLSKEKGNLNFLGKSEKNIEINRKWNGNYSEVKQKIIGN